jgi:hypothetical protein
MTDRNRIHVPGKQPEPERVPIKLDMFNGEGMVVLTFEPPAVRMKLRPREARALAIGLLHHADAAENPAPPPNPAEQLPDVPS